MDPLQQVAASDATNSETTDWWGNLWADEDALELVLKRREKNGEETQVDQLVIPSDEFRDFEDFVAHVRKEYGGGRWVIYRRGERGIFMAGSRKQFTTSGPVRDLSDREDGGQQRTAAPQDLGTLLLQMQAASDARLEKILAVMAEKQKPNDQDELTRLGLYMDIVNKNAQPAVPKEKSLIEQAVEKKILDFLDQGMGGGGGGEFGWVKDLVMEFGTAMATASAGKGGEEGAAPPPTPTLQQPTEEEQKAGMAARLRLMLKGMLQLAAHEIPPANTVEKIKAQAGAQWPALEAIIRRPDAVALASQLEPSVQQHAAWFEEFRVAVIGGEQGKISDSTRSTPGTATRGKPRGKRAAVAGT